MSQAIINEILDDGAQPTAADRQPGPAETAAGS